MTHPTDRASRRGRAATTAGVDDRDRLAGPDVPDSGVGATPSAHTVAPTSRRGLFRRAGIATASLTVGAQVFPLRSLMPTVAAQETASDVDVGAFAESVELAAVAAYETMAATDLLGEAVLELTTQFSDHHRDHAAAIAGLLGSGAAGSANTAVLDRYAPLIEIAVDEAGLLGVALEMEEAVAAMYHLALGLIEDRSLAAAAAQILPVESSHAVVLGQVLGRDRATYLPSFENSDGALTPTEFPR